MSFLNYYWNNSWKLLMFCVSTAALATILTPWEASKWWVMLVIFLSALDFTITIFKYRAYKKFGR